MGNIDSTNESNKDDLLNNFVDELVKNLPNKQSNKSIEQKDNSPNKDDLLNNFINELVKNLPNKQLNESGEHKDNSLNGDNSLNVVKIYLINN
ncbi:surface antigen ariel 1 [Megavirus courdo7]|uniref:Surface antigen ariel 1 n=1 Tax=Megavirus courdo7 TaxID=1128135 RepID=H2E9N4_9VIRU|nr:surface antigen ariel 1 [Megavirus courdo7]